ncbi:hypothetical protein Tco_0200685, partial [Tanacetum coccineum]
HLYGHEWQSQKGRPFDNFAMRVVLKLAEGGLVTAWEEEELPARIEEKGGHETEGSVLRFALEKVWMKELPEAVSRRQVTRKEDLNWGSGSRIIRSEISTGCFDPLSHEYKRGFLSSIPAHPSKPLTLARCSSKIEKSPIQLAEQP